MVPWVLTIIQPTPQCSTMPKGSLSSKGLMAEGSRFMLNSLRAWLAQCHRMLGVGESQNINPPVSWDSVQFIGFCLTAYFPPEVGGRLFAVGEASLAQPSCDALVRLPSSRGC